jgi:hypothetical protein
MVASSPTGYHLGQRVRVTTAPDTVNIAIVLDDLGAGRYLLELDPNEPANTRRGSIGAIALDAPGVDQAGTTPIILGPAPQPKPTVKTIGETGEPAEVLVAFGRRQRATNQLAGAIGDMIEICDVLTKANRQRLVDPDDVPGSAPALTSTSATGIPNRIAAAMAGVIYAQHDLERAIAAAHPEG